MRWLIGLLLLVNLVLFLWGQWYRDTAAEPSGRPNEDVGTIRLWSEAQPAPADADEEPAEATVAAVEPEPAASPAVTARETPELRPPPTAPDASPSELPPLPLPAPARPTSLPAPVMDALAEPALPGAILEPVVDRVASVEPSAPPEPVVQAGAMLVCGRLGGFEDEAAALAWAERLASSGISAAVHAETTSRQSGYWVLLPPQPNLVVAREKRAELREKGVQDLWLFTAGPMRNSISLGMFTGPVRAERRAEEIRALGFDAEVRPKMSNATEYVVEYRMRASQSDAFDRLEPGAAGLETGDVDCSALP